MFKIGVELLLDIKTVGGLIFISLMVMMKHLSERTADYLPPPQRKMPCVLSCFLSYLFFCFLKRPPASVIRTPE